MCSSDLVNNEASVHFTTQNWVVSQVESDPTGLFNIPGVADQVTSTVVGYYAEDLAQDKSHNIEATKSATYIIEIGRASCRERV